MNGTAEADEVISKARGRKDNDGQDAVITTKPLKEAVIKLGELKIAADEAGAKLSAAIQAVAEKSGLLSSVVRRLVNSRGEKFDTEKCKVEQLGIVFEEVGND